MCGADFQIEEPDLLTRGKLKAIMENEAVLEGDEEKNEKDKKEEKKQQTAQQVGLKLSLILQQVCFSGFLELS